MACARVAQTFHLTVSMIAGNDLLELHPDNRLPQALADIEALFKHPKSRQRDELILLGMKLAPGLVDNPEAITRAKPNAMQQRLVLQAALSMTQHNPRPSDE